MTKPQHEPAQRQFVHQLIDWELIRSRCIRYPEIGRAFPLKTMKKRSESPPYYCHYMSLRLGTWEDESRFQRLEQLLCCAKELPNWKHEQPLLSSADFADFWSLVWQLQVAEHLCGVGTDVCWTPKSGGPDLSAKIDNKRWYVECYAPRKSFGLLEYLREILEEHDSDVHAYYDRFLPFNLPQNSKRTQFIDEVLTRFLEPGCLAEAREDAEIEYPVVLYKHPESSLHIYVDGDNCDAYTGILPNKTGEPKFYVECILEEAVTAKKCKNKLKNHRPNLLAVNYSLSDVPVAEMLPHRLRSLTLPRIDPNIDALAVSAVGIDERLTREKLEVRIHSESAPRASLDRIASPTD